MSPCPTGWGYKMSKTVEVAREAIQNGSWVLMEYEDGKVKLGKKPSQLGNVEKYFSMQKRFKGVTQEEMEEVSRHLVERYEYLEKLAAL